MWSLQLKKIHFISYKICLSEVTAGGIVTGDAVVGIGGDALVNDAIGAADDAAAAGLDAAQVWGGERSHYKWHTWPHTNVVQKTEKTRHLSFLELKIGMKFSKNFTNAWADITTLQYYQDMIMMNQ